MARTQTLVQLTDEIVDGLDRVAARLGVSRSKVMRDLLISGLAERDEREQEKKYVDGYRRMPQSRSSDRWGDLASWTEKAGRRARADLAAEETSS